VERIKVVTDSASELGLKEQREFGVIVVPMRVQVGKKIYKEGVDITRKQFLKLVKNTSSLPKLLPPTEEDFYKAYLQASREADFILSIHISRRLVDVGDLITSAATPFTGRLHVSYIDTRAISVGQAELVKKAAVMAKEGSDGKKIIRTIHNMVPHVYQYYYTPALDYMQRDALIRPEQATLGRLLEIKPFLLLEEGVMVPLEKVLTIEQVLDKLYQFVVEFSRFEKVFIQHSGMGEETQKLMEMLESYPKMEGKVLDVLDYGIALATYLGPEGLGVTVCEGLEKEHSVY
jgi:DegV family protein with EDD domain